MTNPTNTAGEMRPSGRNNLAVGVQAAHNLTDENRCTIIGSFVPAPGRDDVIRVGFGNVYLEISDGIATAVGAEPDDVAQAVLRAIADARNMVAAACRLHWATIQCPTCQGLAVISNPEAGD